MSLSALARNSGATCMLTGDQIQRARKLLGWDRSSLTRRAGSKMTANAIRKFEDGDDTALNPKQLSAIEGALAGAGVQFGNNGVLVSRHPPPIQNVKIAQSS